jgi:hypothetical protein
MVARSEMESKRVHITIGEGSSLGLPSLAPLSYLDRVSFLTILIPMVRPDRYRSLY